MIGKIVEIKDGKAKVECAEFLTGYLPFADIPYSRVKPILYYEIGDQVIFELNGSSNVGVITGVIR